MHPTSSVSFATQTHGRTLPLLRSAIVVLVLSGATSKSDGLQLSDTTKVPSRGEYVAPPPTGPVSLTTELFPNSATPLLPEGAEEMDLESGLTIESNKRWTFSVETRTIYDDNIFLSSKGKEKRDVVFLLTPSVTYRRGDTAVRRESYATVGYSPSASFFVDESGENSVDHTARVDMQKRFGNLAVGVDGRYQRLSGATVELSDRVDRDEAGVRLRARYDISSRSAVEASAAWSTVNYRDSSLADYDEWVAETFVGHQLSDRMRVSAGGAVGSMKADGRESQHFTRALVKVGREAAGKLTLDAKGGVEFRETGRGSQTTPVFNVNGEYRPTGRTSLGASFYREVTASGSVTDENVTRTGVAVRVQQMLGRRLAAGVESGYEQLEYAASEPGTLSSGREDEYFFIRPSLRYEFKEGRRAEIYYSLREDHSTVSTFDFEANQTGLTLAFDF